MNKTTEALKLAEALENDAKEHREVSYGLDCPPERTANWKHALNCEAAARLIREELAEQSKCACDSPAWCTKYKKCNREILGLPIAEPVKQEPVAVISESAIGLVKLHSNGACLPFGTQLYAAPVDAKAIRAEALEEAAKVCDGYAADPDDDHNLSMLCAAAIRELK